MSHNTVTTTTNNRRKLIDYTLCGKALPQVQQSRSCGDLPRHYTDSTGYNGNLRRYRSHEDQLDATTSRRSESSNSQDLSNSSWDTPICDPIDTEKVSFYLKIPSRESRKQTSDLRERFSSSRRPCKKASLLNVVLSESQSRRSTKTRKLES